jgi:hypothetical protein
MHISILHVIHLIQRKRRELFLSARTLFQVTDQVLAFLGF